LTGDLGRLPLAGGVPCDLLAALGMTEPNAEEREASDTDVSNGERSWRIVPGESRVIYGLASGGARMCVCVAFQREQGPTQVGGRPRAWQMTGLRA
jgi:hypothetical protein